MHADNNHRRSRGHDPRPARLRLPCPCVRQGHGSPGPRRHQRTRPGRLRSEVARARPHPRLPAQWVCLLHRHAHQGRAGGRRERAAPLRTIRVAGDPLLHRPGTSGARVHRGGDAARGRARPGLRIRRGRRRVRAGRGRRAAEPHRNDQRLEHDRGRHPRLGARLLPALSARGCRYRARKFTNATRGRSTTVSAMTTPDADAAARFLALHRPGRPLLLPNPWDVGSARILASLGFEALATTSSGYAATLGRPDGSVTRQEALRPAGASAVGEVVSAVDRPVNVLAVRGAPTVAELADLGVARISVGGAFAYAALGALAEAARELRTAGTYGYLRGAGIGRQVSDTAFRA